jgi:hypothetical protein
MLIKQKSRIKYYLFLFVICIVITRSEAQESPNNSAFGYKHYFSVFYMTIGTALAQNNTHFISDQQDYFHSIRKELKSSPLFGFGIKVHVSPNFRVGGNVGVLVSNLNEFKENIKIEYPNGGKATQTIDQQFKVKTIPINLTLDYVESMSQFRTNVGIGAGLTYSDIKWQEEVQSTNNNDLRVGGDLYSQSGFYPSISFYAATELGFDKFNQDFFSSLIIQLDYSYTFRKINLYEKVRYQFKDAPQEWNEEQNFFPSYIGLSIGFTFNLSKLKRVRPKAD